MNLSERLRLAGTGYTPEQVAAIAVAMDRAASAGIDPGPIERAVIDLVRAHQPRDGWAQRALERRLKAKDMTGA